MHSIDYYAIGQRIRRFRKIRGLSQEELAEKVDISIPHMSHIETANTKLSLPVLIGLAEALSVHPDDLLMDDTNETADTLSNEILSVMKSCTPSQAKVINDIVKVAKRSMDAYLEE